MDWHRLFGLLLTDFFTDSPFAVELEKDLSLAQQFLDVVILRKGKVIACDSTAGIQSNIEHSTLERTFMHLVEDVDAEKITRDIINVMTMTMNAA